MCSTFAVMATMPVAPASSRRPEPRAGSLSAAQPVKPLESALVEYKDVRFLITERPTDGTMDAYIAEVQKHRATYVVRVGGAAYKTDRLLRHGVQVVDLPFADGSAPSLDIITTWCRLLRCRRLDHPNFCVAIHCAAGLGRAPVMVAIALMELGMRYDDAVEFIRRKRRGAINAKQLDFLSKYRSKSRLSTKNNACAIM